VLRIHQEDLCQALGLPPTQKYQNDRGPKPEQIVKHLRKVMSPLNADGAVARLFDALAWNWLIGGTDAHAKNYSLLLAGGDVRLAPIYDVASALPYAIHERKLNFAMKIGGHYDVVPYPDSWARAADEMGIEREVADDRIRELAALAPDAFAASAASADIVSLKSDLPHKLVDIIADRAARCIKLMDLSRHQRA
jgi:serine/threonine-protein kinase HipA